MFVLSSPSGAGKTTISRKLLAAEQNLRMSVSVTTRPMRPGEVDGKDYIFSDRAGFEQRVAQDGFLEWAEVFGNHYGTPRAEIERLVAGLEERPDVAVLSDEIYDQMTYDGEEHVSLLTFQERLDRIEHILLRRGQRKAKAMTGHQNHHLATGFGRV